MIKPNTTITSGVKCVGLWTTKTRLCLLHETIPPWLSHPAFGATSSESMPRSSGHGDSPVWILRGPQRSRTHQHPRSRGAHAAQLNYSLPCPAALSAGALVTLLRQKVNWEGHFQASQDPHPTFSEGLIDPASSSLPSIFTGCARLSRESPCTTTFEKHHFGFCSEANIHFRQSN